MSQSKRWVTLEGRFATSKFVKRLQVVVDGETGLIESVASPQELGLSTSTLDYCFDEKFLLFAGFGDVHIHAREDFSAKHTYKEDFLSVSQAALAGGVIHLCDMPNNPIPPIDDASYRQKFSLALEKSLVPLLPYAGIGPNTRPLSFSVPYKVYMGPSVGELFFSNQQELEESLSHYSKQWVSFHCEDAEILQQNAHFTQHAARRPVAAEYLATEQAIGLIARHNLQGKLCHFSSKSGLTLIHRAKDAGIPVECEVTPQHLFFSAENAQQFLSKEELPLLQMNPPIRSEEDRQALIFALKEGLIDYLATDHAPHSMEEKMRVGGISGMPGLDTFGMMVSWLIIKEKISPQIIARVAVENPARFFNHFLPTYTHLTSPKGASNQNVSYNLGQGFGFLQRGFRARFSVLNLQQGGKPTQLQTRCGYTPYKNVNFPGRVEGIWDLQSYR